MAIKRKDVPIGPKTPNKYPKVGPNYQYYGEQKNKIYDYLHDKYVDDPKAVEEMNKFYGLGPPKPPGLASSLVPVAATAGAIKGAEALVSDPKGAISGIKDTVTGIGDLFGGGSGPTSATTTSVAAPITETDILNASFDGLTPPSGVNPPMTNDLFGGGAKIPQPGFMNTPLDSLGGFTPTQGLGALGAGYGAYQGFEGIKKGDPLTAGLGAGSLGLGLNAMGLALGPIGWAGMAALPVAAAFGLGKDQKSTKEYQKERWGALGDVGQGAYAASHAEGDDSIWDDGEFAGQKWNFEDATTLAKSDPLQFNAVLGNYETFGKDWEGYSLDDRAKIIEKMIEEDLYHSDKGDILISDKNQKRAKEIRDEVLGLNQDQSPGDVAMDDLANGGG